MRYYLDTEFDGFGGHLLSLALVREDGESIYLVYDRPVTDPWVIDNVVPLFWKIPSPFPGSVHSIGPDRKAAPIIERFLKGDPDPVIISDWPDDIRYLCRELITGPGEMIKTAKRLTFEVVRVDAYPTRLQAAVQHNAWWDAMALRDILERF